MDTDKKIRLGIITVSAVPPRKSLRRLLPPPVIKPVSDLRNYTEVLKSIAIGEPVFLTKNGRGKYVILDMEDYARTDASIKLMTALAKGRKSGEERGWETLENVEAALDLAT